jgi:hypothetical protein
MSEPLHEFEDPALKQAVRRAFAGEGEAAPAALRQRVEAIFAAGAVAGTKLGPAQEEPLRRPDRSWWARQLTPKNAVAAAIALLAIAFMFWELRSEFITTSPPSHYARTTFPDSFAVAMVAAHENCAKLPDHHLIPGKDPASVKAPLAAAAGMTVAATDLGDGWQFEGAGLCNVGGVKAAHLLFARGKDTISMISMPAPASLASFNGTYTEVVQDHPMSGVVSGGAVYCLIASAPDHAVTSHDLELLLERVKVQVGQHGCAGGTPGATALVRS